MRIYSNQSESPMSESFHDWLDQCPVNWYREKITEIDVHYSFDIDKKRR